MESKLISLVTQLMSLGDDNRGLCAFDQKFTSLIIQITSLVRSMHLDSQPKPESELMLLTIQAISLFNSMDFDSQPEPLSMLIPLVTQLINHPESDPNSDSDTNPDLELETHVFDTLHLKPEPELLSLIYKICYLVSSMNSQWEKLISVCPQVVVKIADGKLHVDCEVEWIERKTWDCLPINWFKFNVTGAGGEGEGEEATHFLCRGCNGQNHHQGHEKAPLEIKHPLHPKHPLHLAYLKHFFLSVPRKCYCCDEDLEELIYCCLSCDFVINLTCVEKPPVLSIQHPKWHQHPLSLFSRTTSLICDVCALADSTCPFYICPPCGFVVHRRCIDLPRVIRISRHPHRLSYVSSFKQGDLSCGVCRREIDNDYGGYSCIEKGCSYAAHSKCATQSNVWDGKELEGVPEEDIGDVDPFVRISDEIIQHFSHEHHHLRLDENTNREYDENKLCQACVTPIYFGNLYSCMQCDFFLHEECANHSRKLYSRIHPHLLTLATEYDSDLCYPADNCSACSHSCSSGFSYECDKEECSFRIHVQCATVSEPLVHESHAHPLFLTSKPGEWRTCSVHGETALGFVNETFNCIECEFALCFGCATSPQKAKHKHDKHLLTLSYGKETSEIASWCEVCEEKVFPKERFYMCNEYCCITLHIECMLGQDMYMKPGSSWVCGIGEIGVVPNNHHMSPPICSICYRRCPQKIAHQMSGLIFCSRYCAINL